MPPRAFRILSIFVAGLLTAAPVVCTAAPPQLSAGLFCSPKGFGISVQPESDGLPSWTRYCVYSDIYGLPSGRSDECGVKANMSRCRTVLEFRSDGIRARFYAGPGISAGWVHDLEYSVAGKEHLVNNPGFVAALSGVAGISFSFAGKSWELDFSFSGEAGFHIRHDEFMENKDLTLYKAGLHQMAYPQIIIIKKFR